MTKHSAMLRVNRVDVDRRQLSGNHDGLLVRHLAVERPLIFNLLLRVGP